MIRFEIKQSKSPLLILEMGDETDAEFYRNADGVDNLGVPFQAEWRQ